MSLRYKDRFRPRVAKQRQAAIDADQLRLSDEFEALDPQQLQPLAQLSLFLLLVGLLFFVSLNLISYFWWWRYPPAHLSLGLGLLILLINLLGYLLILPIHEGIHALAFLLWGGRPYFGAKLPLALFCGAREQLFPRNYYLVIALAPLVIITLGAILFTCWRPDLAPYTLLASAGNLSGAAGDVWAVRRLLRRPASVLVEDTDLGYRAWQIERDDEVIDAD